jgi:hypothetical protein
LFGNHRIHHMGKVLASFSGADDVTNHHCSRPREQLLQFVEPCAFAHNVRRLAAREFELLSIGELNLTSEQGARIRAAMSVASGL